VTRGVYPIAVACLALLLAACGAASAGDGPRPTRAPSDGGPIGDTSASLPLEAEYSAVITFEEVPSPQDRDKGKKRRRQRILSWLAETRVRVEEICSRATLIDDFLGVGSELRDFLGAADVQELLPYRARRDILKQTKGYPRPETNLSTYECRRHPEGSPEKAALIEPSKRI